MDWQHLKSETWTCRGLIPSACNADMYGDWGMSRLGLSSFGTTAAKPWFKGKLSMPDAELVAYFYHFQSAGSSSFTFITSFTWASTKAPIQAQEQHILFLIHEHFSIL